MGRIQTESLTARKQFIANTFASLDIFCDQYVTKINFWNLKKDLKSWFAVVSLSPATVKTVLQHFSAY